jgi:DNA-binding CsgD family transcriptional regulator
MARVSASDLRAILEFLAVAPAGGGFDPIPAATLARLRDLLGADEADYFELRRADRDVLGLAESDETAMAPGSEAALEAFGHENPVNWRRGRPGDGARRLSEVIHRRAFERTGFHDGYMRPNGLRDNLKVWLSSDDTSAACIQLWRRDRDFGRREQDMLTVLQHHLVALRRGALDGIGPAHHSSAGLTVREAQILSWAARGESDERIAALLAITTRTVRKHLEHAYASLGVHSRAEAIARVLLPLEAGGPPSTAQVVRSDHGERTTTAGYDAR